MARPLFWPHKTTLAAVVNLPSSLASVNCGCSQVSCFPIDANQNFANEILTTKILQNASKIKPLTVHAVILKKLHYMM